MKIAVVTGASSGMGREFVRQIAKKYKTIEEIWVLARRKDLLLELAEEVTTTKVRPIPCDLTDGKAIDDYQKLLIEEKPTIRVLVNAAGFGIIGRVAELPLEKQVGMCDLNCTALTKMICVSLPYMDENRSNIINLASSAAFMPQPSFAVYAATKSYVLSLSTALNQELKDTGISVTAVCPGPVDTDFFDLAEEYHAVKLYKKMLRAKAPKVVELALRDAYHGSHISVYGFTMKGFRLLCKILPRGFMVKFVS